LSAEVNDTVGNSVAVVWSLNGVPVQTNSVPAFMPPAATNVNFAAVLPAGTNIVTVYAENAAGSVAACDTTVVEVDTNAPIIVSASPSKSSLWPPNHKMVKITVNAQVTDNCSTPTWKIIGVTSNEPDNSTGDGNTSSDWQILNDNSLYLRAERAGNGSGRIYTISLQAEDSVGNLSETNSITVTVPKSQGRAVGHSGNNGNSGSVGNSGNGNSNPPGNSNNPGKDKKKGILKK